MSKRVVRRSLPLRLVTAAALLIVSVAAGELFLAASSHPRVTPAADTTDDDVRVLTGGIHVVHHALRPLPSAAAPRADGLPTLVWFGATWCEVCKGIEGVIATVMTDARGRLVLVEKDVDTEPGLARQFGVRGTPRFVVMDARGRERLGALHLRTRLDRSRPISNVSLLAAADLERGIAVGNRDIRATLRCGCV